jgi:hypothetical protein
MKKILSVALLSLLAASFISTAWGQKPKTKEEYLKEISTLSNTKKPEDTEKAYQLSKEFVAAFPKENNDNAKKVKDFIKRARMGIFDQAFMDKKYEKLFTIGKEILTDEPENTSVAIVLGYSGYDAMVQGNKSFTEDALKNAKLALELMEKGIVPPNFAPFTSKEEALAWLYYAIGYYSFEKDLKGSAISFYKSTLYESSLKKTSQPYAVIAEYYESIFESLSKATSPDAEKINKVADQMMDAYARAIKFGVTEKSPNLDRWKQRITQIYQYRKKTTAGLDPFMTYIVTTPFQDPSNY